MPTDSDSGTDEDSGEGPDSGSSTGTPRWVKVFGIIAHAVAGLTSQDAT